MDLLLFLMTLIWGSNYTIVKDAFAEMPPHPFNAVRMVVASLVFLVAIAIARQYKRPSVFYTPEPVTRRDWLSLFGLAVVGHFLYQLSFIGGLARTSVANSSLILALTPVAIAGLNAVLGRERVGRWHWLGATMSIGGIYLVVDRGPAGAARAQLTGDLLMFSGVVCWAIYTVGAGRLMERHSPLGVTGVSITMGTLIYVPVVLPQVLAVDWSRISATTWIALAYSSICALCVAYMIWYTAVQKIGGTRTSVYSNLVPIVALAVAVLWRGEALGAAKLFGAALVLAGVAMTRAAAHLKTAPPQE
ncbi:MAG TPA: DMT family transporter [Vicinamibacterales bacterium]|nr:DMT family transporter [Vicinamibacterales bacterium]